MMSNDIRVPVSHVADRVLAMAEQSLQLFHMSLGEFDELVNQFLNKDSNHNGMIDFDEFMDLVGLKRYVCCCCGSA